MDVTINNLHTDLLKLRRDMELVKHILMAEGELNNYAKTELKKAREEKEEEYTDLDEL